MNPVVYLVNTEQHGLEPVAFFTEREAVEHADNLSTLAAYRNVVFEVLCASPDNIDLITRVG